MSMQERWDFNKILVHPTEGSLSNVVVTVEFKYSMTDNVHWQSYYGSATLSSPSPGPDFIDFEDITYDEMVNLVKTGLGDEFDTIQAEVTAGLANPLVPLNAPWISTDTPGLSEEDAAADELEEVGQIENPT